MTNLFHLSLGERAPDIVTCVIEVPRNSTNKYEYDPELGIFTLDRVLYSPMHYPGDYGFVPSTHAEDGDPVDVLVLTNFPTFPGTVLRARPLGFLEMADEKGRDQKVLAVPVDDPRYDNNRHISSISPHRLREIEHFFTIYKELEGKETQVEDWRGVEETHAMIRTAHDAYLERHPERAPAEASAPV
ncbi:MAG: inorganic diphosphatase [Trueperaceae bacterium]